jgi:cbb3-type cytochrome oxidase subunit 3
VDGRYFLSILSSFFPPLKVHLSSYFRVTILIVLLGPRWLKGYSVNIAFVFFTWFFFCIGQYLYRRDEKKRAQQGLLQSSDDEEGKLGTGIGVGLEDKAVGEIIEDVGQKAVAKHI